MVINTNISAVNAERTLKFRQVGLQKVMGQISSGKRINNAGDDASGLAVSEKMLTQINGMRQAERNTQDGISFIQTTEGYLQETTEVLQRVRELAVQAANGVYTDEDRLYVQIEVSQLVDEIDRVASQAQFNKLNMLTGRFAQATGENTPTASMWLQIGANMDERKRLYVGTMNSQGLGLKNATGPAATATFISVSTANKANSVIGMVDEALLKVLKQRSDLGAYQNRLELTAQGLMIGHENLKAAESRIRDTNVAEASVQLAKDQILNQANIAMLAQANQLSQGALQLLQ
jgi:flagellin